MILNPYAAGGGGGGASTPTYVSSAVGGIGSVSDGDFVLLFLLSAGGAAPSAPTGWTRHVNTTEANGYALAIYSSSYSASNAAANSTNFPVANGHFETIVYAGSRTVLQTGAKGEGGSSTSTVTAPALGSATGANSALIGWHSDRDKKPSLTETTTMTRRLMTTAPTYFSAAIFEQAGVQSGTRTFSRGTTGSFNHVAFLLEIG